MLPDEALAFKAWVSAQESQCTYRCVVLPDEFVDMTVAPDFYGLNAPTGAWCSLTAREAP